MSDIIIHGDAGAGLVIADKQVQLAACAAGEAKNSLNETVATVPSGGEGQVADSAVTVNSVPFANTPATKPLNVRVVTPQGAETGSLNNDGDWQVEEPAPAAPAEPSVLSTFAPLYRSDSSFTLVNGFIDIWADSSVLAAHASAQYDNDRNRLSLAPSAGNFGFGDVIAGDVDSFYSTTGAIVGTFEKFSVLFHGKRLSRKLPDTNTAKYIFEFGNINNNELLTCMIINDQLEVRLGNNDKRVRVTYGYENNIDLLIVYDGTQANEADRLKIYLGGVEAAQTLVAGANPTSVTCDSSMIYLGSAHTGVRTMAIQNLLGFKPAALTAQEVSDLHSFTSQIWQ